MSDFFESMKRMLAGKPVFEDPGQSEVDKTKDAPSPEAAETAAEPESSIRKHEDRTFPVVHVRQVKTHLDGNNIQIYCHIQNTWNQEVMLDKIRLLGTKRELDTHLRAGEDREFLVYKGPKLQHEDHEVLLDYKTAHEGDYFQARHEADFTFQPDDKTYLIRNIELRLPIRDIYG